VVLVAALPLLGNRSNCDSRTPDFACQAPILSLVPGECRPLLNPCDQDWVIQDTFDLCDPPDGFSVRTTRTRGVVRRELCAATALALGVEHKVDFLYTLYGDFGEGTFSVAIAEPLQVTASASPNPIAPGESSQLDAAVSGGVGPYSYGWTPASSLSDPLVRDPVASPSSTTTYAVRVIDSRDEQASDIVTVAVASPLIVTANPSSIPIGFSSQLNALLPGGIPPFTYDWQPTNTLSDPSVSNPIAVPSNSTTYQVTVYSGGAPPITGSVDVEVQLRIDLTATPNPIFTGGSSQLQATVRGGLPPYTYDWQPAASLDDPSSPAPLATPSETTTYDLSVTDSLGQTLAAQVTVDVDAPAALEACFMVIPDPPPAVGQVTYDFGCSTGVILLYELWLGWTGDATQPPVHAASGTSHTRSNEFLGCHDVRLQVTDDGGDTAEVVQQVCYQ
jgi:hypothetical protein